MKRQTIMIFSAAILSLGFPVMTAAVAPPGAPDLPHGVFACSVCHTGQAISGSAAYNNICLGCHKPGSPMGGGKPFTLTDAANPFRTITSARIGTIFQISHNWSGSDTLPAAGAQPPLDPNLINPNTPGQLACVRCHAPHVQTYPPFLRVPNDRDQMCLDCHRARNSTSHTAGTHPVNVSYSSAVSRKPARFNKPPLNSNPANPTSALNLINGTVLCSTCHRVHYADSNSATPDGPAGYYSLTPSAGYLLRTDLRGATAASLNICTDCHKKAGHSGVVKQQNVQCADCHAGHVDVADGTVPNVYLVRRYMNISTPYGAVRKRAVFFQTAATAARNYKDANGTGVCQACHVVPVGAGYPAEHAGSDTSVCMSCHSHDNLVGSFSAAGGCTTCHGQPPKLNVAGGPDGFAGSYFALSGVSEATTPHKRHAGGGSDYGYSCEQCHKGNSHNSGTFQDLFIDRAGLIGATAGALPAYDGGTRSCANVYCHSNGAPRNASLAPVLTARPVPAWPNGAGKVTGCSSCHDASPVTNAHAAHIGKGYGCPVCHAATVSDNVTIADRARHADGIKTIVLSTPMAVGTTWNAATATCTTSSCHSNGSAGGTGAPVTVPKWVDPATGKCGSCHYTSPAIAATSAQTIATNAHGTHLAKAYGPAAYLGTALSACQACHDYSQVQPDPRHVNGIVDLLTGTGSNCARCHAGTAPPWTSTARLACQTCHGAVPATLPNGVAAPAKVYFDSAGHGLFAASSQCAICHDSNSAHISGVLGDAVRLTLPNDNSLCGTCHNGTTAPSMSTHVLDKNATPTPDLCRECHDVHGSTNIHMIRTTIKGKRITFTNMSSGFVKTTAPYDGLCQVCHTLTNHYRAGVAETGHPAKNCLSCHSHTAAPAFLPAGACDSCHGYPPAPPGFTGSQGNYAGARAEDYPNGGGAHTITGHIRQTAVPTEGWANCTVCHGNGSPSPATHLMTPVPPRQTNITIDVDDDHRFNSALPLDRSMYSGPLSGSGTTGRCSNTSCHLKPSPVWAP